MSEKDICMTCGCINGEHFNCHTDLYRKLAEKEKEIENLIWNLAGCSTFALGYGIDEPYDEKSARPAMKDVLTLAKRERQFRKALENMLKELGVPQPDYPAPIVNAVDIAKAALGKTA